jgi:NCAIR mutase (PurE)-related protein
VRSLVEHGEQILATRIDAEQAAGLLASFPRGRYNDVGRTFRLEVAAKRNEPEPSPDPSLKGRGRIGRVAVISAGTGDLPVAEEARETLDWMGVAVTMIHDVGVAGPHRLPARLADFEQSDAIVVVAGMEGALPSVVGGYVACPIFAVPTSIGYGANFGGLSALLSMLNSCANNVAVVNIDAGFKAGFLAGLVATGKGLAQRREDAKENA